MATVSRALHCRAFTGLIVLRHVTASREATHQSWVKTYSPRIPVFKSNIYLDSLLLLFDDLWKVKAEYMV